MLAAQSSRAVWYFSRGTGLVALVLLTVSVVLGVTEVTRWASARWPRFVTAALHRNVSLLVTVFIALHVMTVVIDGFAPIRWLDAVVPFTSVYRPIWLGFGAVAFDLLLALVVTSLLRVRLGYRAWRVVHWASYACWPVAMVHGLGTGSDTQVRWVQAVYVVALVVVVASVWWRLATATGALVGVRTTAAFASVVLPAALVAWTMLGPARTGWASRAGTPRSLLVSAGTSAAASSATPPSPAQGSLSPPFTALLSGRVQENDNGDRATITISGDLAQGAAGTLSIELRGEALPTGGVRMVDSAVALGPTDQPNLYRGKVTGLDGGRIAASLSGPGGRGLQLSVRLRIDEATGVVRGTVQGVTG